MRAATKRSTVHCCAAACTGRRASLPGRNTEHNNTVRRDRTALWARPARSSHTSQAFRLFHPPRIASDCTAWTAGLLHWQSESGSCRRKLRRRAACSVHAGELLWADAAGAPEACPSRGSSSRPQPGGGVQLREPGCGRSAAVSVLSRGGWERGGGGVRGGRTRRPRG